MNLSAQITSRLFLDAGLAAGALFITITLVEIFARPGFDIYKHAISVLSLGERGWLMIGVFIVSGLLTMLAAYGLGHALPGVAGGVVGALLVGIFGAGLIMAGIFPAPAGLGFPPGTPHDMQPVMDRGAMLHSVSFMIAFGSLILACFAYGIHYLLGGQAIWSAICIIAGVAIPMLIALGMKSTIPTGIAFYLATVVAWGWLAAILIHARLDIGAAAETAALLSP